MAIIANGKPLHSRECDLANGKPLHSIEYHFPSSENNFRTFFIQRPSWAVKLNTPPHIIITRKKPFLFRQEHNTSLETVTLMMRSNVLLTLLLLSSVNHVSIFDCADCIVFPAKPEWKISLGLWVGWINWIASVSGGQQHCVPNLS